MNTKKYMRMFGQLAESGEIPVALYERLMSEITARGKMTPDIYKMYLTELEKLGLFDVEGTPFNKKNSAQTDGTYVYNHSKNPFWHMHHAFWTTVAKLVSYPLSAVYYGIWRIKDRKKIKKLGACISVSNHVGYIDCCITRRSFGFKKLYFTVAPHNCKRNLGGLILNGCGTIPLPISIKGARPCNEFMRYVADRKGAIHIYAEQAMWVDYEKPRPYKDGAFFYATMLDLPVVPMLYCFSPTTGLRKLLHLRKVTVKIADPIYADKSLPPVKRRADLAQKVQDATIKMYQDFYGKPLRYLTVGARQADKS